MWTTSATISTLSKVQIGKAQSRENGIPVWMNALLAEELGVNAGDNFSVTRDDVDGAIPIAIAGAMESTPIRIRISGLAIRKTRWLSRCLSTEMTISICWSR